MGPSMVLIVIYSITLFGWALQNNSSISTRLPCRGTSIIELIPICRWLLTLSSSFAHARASTRLRKKDVAEKREGRELQLLRLVESTHQQSKTTEGQIEYGSPGIVRQRGPVSDYITGGEEMRDIKKTELDQGGGEKLIFFSFESIVIYCWVSKSLYRHYPAVGHDNIFLIRQI